jgi:hypothetical protein
MRPISRGFCINRFGIGPLHYNSSRSDFGFKFPETVVIEKRLPDSASQGVGYSPTQGVRESLTLRLRSRDSPTHRFDPRLAELKIWLLNV